MRRFILKRPGINRAKCAALISTASHEPAPNKGAFTLASKQGIMVKTVVTKGTKWGIYIGRVSVRASSFFNITTPTGTTQGISYRYCTPIHKSDGYLYEKGEALSSATLVVAVSPRQVQ